LAFNHQTGTLLVGGDGSSSGVDLDPPDDLAHGVTLSLWKVEGHDLELHSSYGQPRPTGLAAAVVGTVLGACGAPSARWRVQLSPGAGEQAALVTHRNSCLIVSMTDGRPIDPRGPTAGGQLPSSFPSLLGPRPVALTSGVADAQWWGPGALAVASLSGAVAVAKLPGAFNILSDAPAAFSPGAVAAPQAEHQPPVPSGSSSGGAAATGHELTGSLLVVEPIQQPPGDHTTARRQQQWFESIMLEASQSSAGGGGEPRQSWPQWLAMRLGVGAEYRAACASAAAACRTGTAAPDAAPAAGWRLVRLERRSAAQMVALHLRDQDWGRALRLAKAAGVGTDVVYKARWAAAAVSKVNIQVCLARC
jgi:hypothetical protein